MSGGGGARALGWAESGCRGQQPGGRDKREQRVQVGGQAGIRVGEDPGLSAGPHLGERTPGPGCPVRTSRTARQARSQPGADLAGAVSAAVAGDGDEGPERGLPDEVPDEVSVHRLLGARRIVLLVVHRHDDLQLHCARSMRRGLIATRTSRRVRGAAMAPVPGGRPAVTRCRAAAFARRHAARRMRRWVRRRRPPPDRLSRLNDRDARVVSRRTCGPHLLAFANPPTDCHTGIDTRRRLTAPSPIL
jgi:hypothetical protein